MNNERKYKVFHYSAYIGALVFLYYMMINV